MHYCVMRFLQAIELGRMQWMQLAVLGHWRDAGVLLHWGTVLSATVCACATGRLHVGGRKGGREVAACRAFYTMDSGMLLSRLSSAAQQQHTTASRANIASDIVVLVRLSFQRAMHAGNVLH